MNCCRRAKHKYFRRAFSSCHAADTVTQVGNHALFQNHLSRAQVLLRTLSFCIARSQRHGISVHSSAIKLGLDDHLLLNNHLLSFYSKSCQIDHARKLFDEMPSRDVVSWTAIISACGQRGDREEAVELFQQMLVSGLMPNSFTLSTILCCASSLSCLQFGACIHAWIVKCQLEGNAVLGSALLGFYAKCDNLEEAHRVFAVMGNRDTVSWTTMISAYVEAGVWSKAMQLYSFMLESGVLANGFTFAKLLKACASLGAHYTRLAHAQVIRLGLELNVVLKTALVNAYCKCQRMTDAVKVSKQTMESDVMLWTALIAGYSEARDCTEAIIVLKEMEIAGISPNSFTFAKLLDVCSDVPAPVLGKQIHSRTIKAGLAHDVSVGNALVDMYAKCFSEIKDFVHAFEAMASPNVISWTALIGGLARHELDGEAFEAFAAMQASGVQPNSFTLSTILRGCGSPQFLAHAEKLHAYIIKTKLDASDISIGNSLVDVYTRFGRPNEAWSVSRSMPSRDILTYTTLAKGLNRIGLHHRALDMLACIRYDDLKMDDFSIACFLSSSAGLAAVDLGRQLHSFSVKSNYRSMISVSNALVDMYGKCGCIVEAHRAFTEIQEPNVVSWNGLLSGLASNGHFSAALSAFEDMRLAGISPDAVTFLLVLYACSHSGLVDMGVEYFNSMSEFYSVPQQPDHYVCLVDMLGRAGKLEEASCTIETMPFEPDGLIYKTLLGHCKIYGNLVLGECIARRAIELNPMDPAVYVLLAGIYDDSGKLEMAEETRRMMRERLSGKCPGQSWVMQN